MLILGVKMEPRWGQVGPSWAKLGPSWGQVAMLRHLGAILEATWMKMASKMMLRCRKIGEEAENV